MVNFASPWSTVPITKVRRGDLVRIVAFHLLSDGGATILTDSGHVTATEHGELCLDGERHYTLAEITQVEMLDVMR